MNEMTHDEFLERLEEIEPATGADALESLLPPDAFAHARSCEDCTRTAEALLLMSREDVALFDEPDAGYWQGFDERLAARLASTSRPAEVPTRRWPWLRAAAVLAIVVGLSAALLDRSEREADPEELALDLRPSPEALDDAIELWSEDDFLGPAPLEDQRSFATLADDSTLAELFGSPSDSLIDDYTRELDDAQAAELARRLRAEISS